MRPFNSLAVCLITFTILTLSVAISYASGNAEVYRIRNLQFFPLAPGDVDVTRTRNLQLPPLAPGNIDITRIRNLQIPILAPGSIDITSTRNLQCPELAPGYTDITRTGNLQCSELEPGHSDVSRTGNIQYFELEDLPPILTANITDLLITDQNGTQKTDFVRGDIVEFHIMVLNTGTIHITDALIIITVLDSTNMTVFISYTYEDLFCDITVEIIFGYRISGDAAFGEYTVKAMVFTDWPSEGGICLDMKTAVFTVG